MHPFLTKQQINYAIYVIEPVENVIFNRGLLMNIGFNEVMKDQNKTGLKYNCMIFHDVDMIPETEKTLYLCNEKYPVHFAVAVSKWDYA